MLRAAEQDRPDVKAKRDAWREKIPDLDADRLVFIDETWASTNMTPTRGRAPQGERLVSAVPHGHWKTTTFIGALRTDGLTAPAVFDCPVNGETFRAYVEQMLVPTLRPGDIVVMDNLGSHKVAGVAEAIEASGCLLAYLPPYSPDFNPIENLFSKFKKMLRRIGARTVRALWRAVGDCLDSFAPDECRNYFRHCGYCT